MLCVQNVYGLLWMTDEHPDKRLRNAHLLYNTKKFLLKIDVIFLRRKINAVKASMALWRF